MENIVCFGCGADGEAFASMVKGKIRIAYFLDNRQDLWGNITISGYHICQPSRNTCEGKKIVVTTTRYYQEIKKQLEGYGLQEGRAFGTIIDFLMKHNEIGNDVKPQIFLRKRKNADYKRIYKGLSRRENLGYEVYRNAVLIPLRKFDGDQTYFGRGGVVDGAGNYVESSAVEGRMEGAYDYSSPEYMDKKVVYCGYLTDAAWGDFLTESVARCWYILQNDLTVESYVFITESASGKLELDGNVREFFRLLGMEDRVEMIDTPVRYRELVIPQMAYSIRHYYSKQYQELFAAVIDQAVRNRGGIYYPKVFLSRGNWALHHTKREFGNEMLDDFFHKNGYEIIYPEALSLTQLICILQNADTVASVSGSGAHNILFGRDGQKMIIIDRTVLNNEIQVEINKIKALDVTHVDANLGFFPVGFGTGPFLYYMNSYFREFIKTNHMADPAEKFQSKEYLCKNLGDFFQAYNRELLPEGGEELIKDARTESLAEIEGLFADMEERP